MQDPRGNLLEVVCDTTALLYGLIRMHTYAVCQLSTSVIGMIQEQSRTATAFRVGFPSSPEWRSSWRDVRVATKSWSDKSGLTLDSKILH